jgi:hypothetical protein
MPKGSGDYESLESDEGKEGYVFKSETEKMTSEVGDTKRGPQSYLI